MSLSLCLPGWVDGCACGRGCGWLPERGVRDHGGADAVEEQKRVLSVYTGRVEGTCLSVFFPSVYACVRGCVSLCGACL